METTTQPPTDMHDTAQALREMADQLDKVGPENIARYAIVAVLMRPCSHEEEEGFAHEEVGMALGGNMDLAAEAVADACKKMTEIAPISMLKSVLHRTGQVHRERAQTQPTMPPAMQFKL